MAALLPRGVVAYEMKGLCSADSLLVAERDCLAKASAPRLQEFAAGRACARAALSALGWSAGPILVGADRSPVWPPGFAGSISHTMGYCLAVAAKRSDAGAAIRSLGVDAETMGSVTSDLWPHLMRDEEVNHLLRLGEAEQAVHASLIFSAKEAFYKAQYPLTHGWINFEDVAVELGDSTFVATLRNTDLPIAKQALTFEGKFRIDYPYVVTAMAI